MVVRTVLSQHIARVERAWHKALDTLQKLQDRRRKHALSPVHTGSDNAPIGEEFDDQSQSAPDHLAVAHEHPIDPPASTEPTVESGEIHEFESKSVEQSHRGREVIPANADDPFPARELINQDS